MGRRVLRKRPRLRVPVALPPPGYRAHVWVAACTFVLEDAEVDTYRRLASQGPSTNTNRDQARNPEVSRPLEVLDVYCERCGARPGGREAWCPVHPGTAYGLPVVANRR